MAPSEHRELVVGPEELQGPTEAGAAVGALPSCCQPGKVAEVTAVHRAEGAATSGSRNAGPCAQPYM